MMKMFDCVNAVSVDGGGSSEMIVNDKIVNRPSDGVERAIGSAIFVYAK
jgi:exopolysaccharide biosynthesis protein